MVDRIEIRLGNYYIHLCSDGSFLLAYERPGLNAMEIGKWETLEAAFEALQTASSGPEEEKRGG